MILTDTEQSMHDSLVIVFLLIEAVVVMLSDLEWPTVILPKVNVN